MERVARRAPLVGAFCFVFAFGLPLCALAESGTSEAPPPAGDANADAPPAPNPAPEAGLDASSASASTPAPEVPAAPVDVSVVGTRVQQTSGSAHTVSSKQLERFEHDDPHKVLAGVPGVYVRTEDGYGLRPNIGMRGAISDRSKKVTLMEDGVLFGPAPYSAPAAYYFPLITRMQSVRVVKGPSSIVYGPHTVAGAIDLITASIPEGEKVMLDAGVGQYGSRKLHLRASAAGEHQGLLVEGVHVGTAGFKELDGGGDTGFSRNEIMAKGMRTFGDPSELWHEVELKLGYSNEYSNETYLGLTDGDFEKNPYRRHAASKFDRMEWHRFQIALTHRLKKNNSIELTTTLYRNDLARVWNKVNGFRGASLFDVLSNPSDPVNAVYYQVLTGAIPAGTSGEILEIGPNDRRFSAMGAQAALLYRPNTWKIAHRIELGTRIHYDTVKRVHTQRGYELIDQIPTMLDDRVETTADNDANSIALAIYGVDAATFGPITLTAGARVESIRGEYRDALDGRHDVIWQQVLLPGAGVFAALPHDFGLLAGVYQGFSPVPPGQQGFVRPEKSVNYEWGVRYSPRRFRAELIGFYNNYSNLANICTFSSGCTGADIDQQTDGGHAHVGGVEVYAESELNPWKNIAVPGRLAYTWTLARFASDFNSNDPIFGNARAGDAVPYIPAHQVNASIGVETARFGVHLGASYVDSMPEVAGEGNELKTDAYFLLDAAANVRVVEGVSAYVTGKNLTNTAYIASHRPFGARPGAPLWIQAGVKLEL